MADLRIQYNEKMVGNASPVYSDTLNRHANAYHLQDGINALPYGETALGASVSIPAGQINNWVAITGLQIILPLAGVYKVTMFMNSNFIKNSLATVAFILGKLYDVTNALEIPNSIFMTSYCNTASLDNEAFAAMSSISAIIVTASDNVTIEGQVHESVVA